MLSAPGCGKWKHLPIPEAMACLLYSSYRFLMAFSTYQPPRHLRTELSLCVYEIGIRLPGVEYEIGLVFGL